jgi:hypothetical protein
MTGTTQVVQSNTTSKEYQAALDMIFAAERKQRDAQATTTARALEDWRTKYRAERARVLGTGLQAQLDGCATRNKTPGLLPLRPRPLRPRPRRELGGAGGTARGGKP